MDTVERKFYPLDRFPGYCIDSNGFIKDPDNNILTPYISYNRLFYKIGNRGYLGAKLVWETFYGEAMTYIRYADGNFKNISVKNLYMSLDIEHKNDSQFYINGVLFTLIPGMTAYAISRAGTVYSIKRRQFIARSFNHAGYPTVALVDDSGFRSPRKVHRLVYQTYIGELEEGMVIDHIDTNILNPEYTNLQQINNRDNVMKAYDFGNAQRPFNTEEIEAIAKMLSEEKNYQEILEALGQENTTQNYHALVSLVHKLRSRKGYADIADRYNVPAKAMNSSRDNRRMALTDDEINYIISEHLQGRTQQSLANEFNCSQSLISIVFREYKKQLANSKIEGSTTIERIA